MAAKGAMAGLVVLATLGVAVGWQDCSVDPSDRWVSAESNRLPSWLLDQHRRRYTCLHQRGAYSLISNSRSTAALRSRVHGKLCFCEDPLPIICETTVGMYFE